jgi:hypothetical protein
MMVKVKVLAVIFNKEIWGDDIHNGGWQSLHSMVCLQFLLTSLLPAVKVISKYSTLN